MKNRLAFLIFGIILLALMASTPATQQRFNSADQNFKKFVKKISNNGWVYFKENFKTDPKEFFTSYMKEFGLSSNDEMRLVKEEEDSVFTFYRFQHYYKGIKVEGSSMSLQFNGSFAELAFGTLARNLNLDTQSTIDFNTAFEIAKKESKAKLFAWESERWESMIRKELKDSSATYKPKPELIITMAADKEYKLTYKFFIISIEPKLEKAKYYVDANTSKFVKKVESILDATSPCKVYYYTEDKTITTYFVNGFPRGHWRLQDRTRGIITAKLNQYYYYYDWYDYDYLNDWDNYWDWLSERPATSAIWAAQKSYDYFHTLGRHGTDGNNREIRLHTMYPDFNAGWDNDNILNQTWDDIVVGFISDTCLGALDVIGHEYTHGVSNYTANFEYVADESGALSEGFSDIFGETIEYYVDGSCDWKAGGDFFTLRSLDNPHESHSRYGYDHGHLPAYWHENGYWYFGLNVPTYTHKNCGVIDYWYYLLVNGDSQLGVTGIGISSAALIAYRTLSTYLYNTPNATFNVAREASINAAIYYYGICSNQYKQVMNAWAAVGVGDPAPDPCDVPLEASISGPSSVYCGNTEYWYTYPTGGTGSYSIEWYVNYDLVSNSNELQISFPYGQSGEYLIDLVVTSGEETVYDELYVWVDCYQKGNSIVPFSLNLYPNPAKDIATLEIVENENIKTEMETNGCSVYLLDNNGKTINVFRTKNTKIDLNISNLLDGTYHVVVLIGEKKSSINLIVSR